MKKQKKIKEIWAANGKWIKVNDVEYITCCDCGLVHRMEFKVEIKNCKPKKLWLRFWRHAKLTKKERVRIIREKI